MKWIQLLPALVLLIMILAFAGRQTKDTVSTAPHIIILGTIQDGGSPHPGCNKACCKDLFEHPDYKRKVVSLGVIDPENKQTWLFEATPDLTAQMKMLKNQSAFKTTETPDGIFLTHAHIGHYTGLMYLGKEALNTSKVPVYAMPKMKSFLETNGPWSQLVKLDNISLSLTGDGQPVKLSSNIKVTPFLVPHRDEYSETVGYLVEGPRKKLLFIPDINKWNVWNKDIVKEIAKVDYAFIDGTFYDGNELGGRNMAEIPHPIIIESMKLMNSMNTADKGKVYFIHFNHTNPVIDPKSIQALNVVKNGFHVAQFGQQIDL